MYIASRGMVIWGLVLKYHFLFGWRTQVKQKQKGVKRMLLPSVEGQEGGKWIVIDSGMSAFFEPACLILSSKIKRLFQFVKYLICSCSSYIPFVCLFMSLESLMLCNSRDLIVLLLETNELSLPFGGVYIYCLIYWSFSWIGLREWLKLKIAVCCYPWHFCFHGLAVLKCMDSHRIW